MNIRLIEKIVDQEVKLTPEFSTPSSLMIDATMLTLHAFMK